MDIPIWAFILLWLAIIFIGLVVQAGLWWRTIRKGLALLTELGHTAQSVSALWNSPAAAKSSVQDRSKSSGSVDYSHDR